MEKDRKGFDSVEKGKLVVTWNRQGLRELGFDKSELEKLLAPVLVGRQDQIEWS